MWLLQGSVRGGRGWVQAMSSRTFSSVGEIFLLHRTSRVRRPPLQLRLHSDQLPTNHLGGGVGEGERETERGNERRRKEREGERKRKANRKEGVRVGREYFLYMFWLSCQ